MGDHALQHRIDATNAVTIAPEEMIKLIAAVERLPSSATHDDAGTLVRALFPLDTEKQRAALLRCHALVETLDRECPWLHSTGQRQTVLLQPAMSAAAAQCPLVVREGSLMFERGAFLAFTLAAAVPVGHA